MGMARETVSIHGEVATPNELDRVSETPNDGRDRRAIAPIAISATPMIQTARPRAPGCHPRISQESPKRVRLTCHTSPLMSPSAGGGAHVRGTAAGARTEANRRTTNARLEHTSPTNSFSPRSKRPKRCASAGRRAGATRCGVTSQRPGRSVTCPVTAAITSKS